MHFNMVSHEPPEAICKALDDFEYAYGHVSYFFFKSDSNYDGLELHRCAANGAMESMLREEEVALEKRTFGRTQENAAKKVAVFEERRIRWDIEKASAEKIDFESFMGRDSSKGYCFAYYLSLDGGYRSSPKNQMRFDTINNYVLDDDPESLDIYSWSNNWSNYFDAGKDGFGTFFWTIHQHGSNTIVVICSSEGY